MAHPSVKKFDNRNTGCTVCMSFVAIGRLVANLYSFVCPADLSVMCRCPPVCLHALSPVTTPTQNVTGLHGA
jgi:hypothetical protein